MISALIPPLVSLLIGFPGLPSLSTLKAFRHKLQAAPRDTIPPVWKSASRLALEDSLVQAALPRLVPQGGGIRLAADPRKLHVEVDPTAGTLRAAPEYNEVALGPGAEVPLNRFGEDLSTRTFRRLWAERSRSSINSIAGGGGAPSSITRTGPFSIEFPSPLPRRFQSFLGPGGPALSVTGSESIKLSGQSDWTNQQTLQLGQRRSLFPSLDMQQDLNIQLEGQLSDRVKVNLLQNSANQIPLANRIAINYKGDEDDLVQALDLGNTNLSLPGTQYVSYSGRNEGLFGMKATTRLGPLDFTLLTSKQEGKSERASYAGGSAKQDQSIPDFNYLRGTYFFLYDPNSEATRRVDVASIQIYRADGGYSTQADEIRGRAFMDPTTAQLTCGPSPPCDTTRAVRAKFRKLIQGADQDYEVLTDVYGPNFPVIRLKLPISAAQQILAATYAYQPVDAGGNPVVNSPVVAVGGRDTIDVDSIAGVPQSSRIMKLLVAPERELLPDSTNTLYYEQNPAKSPFIGTRELELKNFYQLPGQRIAKETFKLEVRKHNTDPPVSSIPNGGESIPYFEAMGLDNVSEQSGAPVPRQHDGVIDGVGVQSNTRYFVDFENGILFFPDLRPFAPRIAGTAPKPFEAAISHLLFRRDSLVGPDNSPDAANAAIYDKRVVDQSTDVRYDIGVSFTAAKAGNEINIGRGNILEGSEVVTVNGQTWTRDRDYRIDYDLGRITLIRQLGPADQFNVDYSYAPLFQQAGRTLVGSAFRLEGKDKNLGGAFLYEAKGAQDLRPRLGEEPTRMLIGDLNTEWHFKPGWMTRLVDDLPGVRTTAGSEFVVSAEGGSSFPNPNTRNEVFIDDMEGVRDAVSLTMTSERWRYTSLPVRLLSNGFPDSIQRYEKNTELHWYSPLNAVKERDLKPSLTNAQGAQNSHQVLALSLPRRPADWPDVSQPLWCGLTYVLDPVGVDLSKSQFIDVWINDFRDFHQPGSIVPTPRVRGEHVKLHIDLGTVAEDQMRAPNVLPNGGGPDTEDKDPKDGKLSVTGDHNEDTGLDGVLDADEHPNPVPDLTTVNVTGPFDDHHPYDPNGDDFVPPWNDGFHDIDPRHWTGVNGTENNHLSFPLPDNEDIDLSGGLDQAQNYFEYTIDLGDTASTNPYLVTDVFKSFSVYANDNSPVPADDGWRRYRIPIADSLRVKIGIPDLAQARHVRVWLEDIREVNAPPGGSEGEQRPFVMLGGLEIAGSRWRAEQLDTTTVESGTTLTLNSVNTLDNADIYVAPFDPGRTRNGSQEVSRREQSLALEFTELRPGTSLEVFKTFSLDENYSRYGTLTWFTAAFDIRDNYVPAADSLFYFMRFASDEQGLNYYEYRARMPASSSPGAIGWQEVALKLTDLSNLKLNADFPKNDPISYRVPGRNPNETFIIKGRPSFTRIRRISFGIVNDSISTHTFHSGQAWLDELRATDVAKDPGRAGRVSVTGHMANLLSYNVGWNGQDENFQSVGETRGSGNNTSNLSVGGQVDLHRFFEATGIVLPVTFNLNTNRAQPRYTAGDDVLREGAFATASESRFTNRNYAASYSRTWSDRANPFLLYTLGGISANISRAASESRTPTSVDTSRSLSAGVAYMIAPRKLVTLRVPGFKNSKFYPLPASFFWNYGISTSEARSYDRQRDSTGSLVPRYNTTGRTANIDFGADSRPIDPFHHHFQATRNLTLPEFQRQQFGFINLGRVVRWSQNMDWRYPVNRGVWLNPTLNWNSDYAQNNGPELSPDLSVRSLTNHQTMNVTWDLPFDRLDDTPTGQGPTTPRDTTRRVVTIAPWRRWFARLGLVGTEAGFNKASNYSRVLGTPDFFYLSGLSSDPGLAADSSGRVRPVFGNVSSDGYGWKTAAHSRVLLAYDAKVTTRFDYRVNQNTTNAVRNRNQTLAFPDLDFDYGRVAEVLGLSHFLSTPRLRTVFQRTRSTDFSNSSNPTLITTSSQWRPLVGVTGDLKNNTRVEFRIERRISERESRLVGQSVAIDRNTDVNLSLNRSYTQGQKVNFLGKETTVKSSVNLRLSAVYSRQSGGTIQTKNGQQLPIQFPVNKDRLSLNAGGSYGFSNNVTGNVDLGFGQDRDLLLDIVHRNVRVELRAQFTF